MLSSYQFGHMYSYFMGYTLIIIYLFLFILPQIWPLEALSGWSLCTFDMTPSFFSLSLCLTSQDVLDSPYIFPTPGLESVISLRCSGSFIVHWTMVFRNQNLSSWCTYWYCIVMASRPSQWTELGNIFMYTQTTHFYLFFYFLLCIYVTNHEFIFPVPLQHHGVHSSLCFSYL